MTFYFDLETTAPTDNCYDPEQKEMFVVSYVIIVSFHPDLKMKKIICERSYGYNLKKLNTIDYLSEDQIKFCQPTTLKQLRDVVHLVSLRKCKKTMAQMRTIEMFLLKETLGAWFSKKIKSNNLSIKPLDKIQYEQKNPVDWSQDKCLLSNFKLDIMPTNVCTPDSEMRYGDFYIRQEHKFLCNIYSRSELAECEQIKTLSTSCDTFQKLVNICFFLQNVWTARDFDDFCILTKCFVREECNNNFTISDQRDNINDVEIKGFRRSKIPHRLLKVMA